MTTTTEHRSEHTPYLRVYVTKRNVEEAIKASGSLCIASQAINTNYPDMLRVKSDLQTIRMTDKKTGRRYVYLTPRKVVEMLVAFDQGIKPKPFSFILQRGQVLSYSIPTLTVERGVPIRTGGKAPPRVKGIPYKRAFGICNLSKFVESLQAQKETEK